MDILSAITQQCDALTTTVSPGIDNRNRLIESTIILIQLWAGSKDSARGAGRWKAGSQITSAVSEEIASLPGLEYLTNYR